MNQRKPRRPYRKNVPKEVLEREQKARSRCVVQLRQTTWDTLVDFKARTGIAYSAILAELVDDHLNKYTPDMPCFLTPKPERKPIKPREAVQEKTDIHFAIRKDKF